MLFVALAVLILTVRVECAEVELTSSSLCDICNCGPGPGMNPKEKAVCKDLGDGIRIKVASLPHFVTSLVVENATSGVTVMRGAIRVTDSKFRLAIHGASHLDMTEKSITLLSADSESEVSIDKVENINFVARTVSASKPGRFNLRVTRSGTVTIDSRAFDVLDDVTFDEVKSLRLSMSAFKPNLPIETPLTSITFRRVATIPQLPTETFSSSLSIVFIDCNVGEIESSAFSGFSVINVTFVRTSINRIHSRAFPEKSLLNRLTFSNCSLSSVAEKSISSAISLLEIRNSSLASLSAEAVFSHVAKVDFSGNNFQTLSHRSFIFQSWNEILFRENRIMFMESGSLVGIDVPGEADAGTNVSFVFTNNHIHYANKDALNVALPSTVDADVDENVFYKYCECGVKDWLAIVCGAVVRDQTKLDLTSLLQESSQCQVPEVARPCFQSTTVGMNSYIEKFCGANDAGDVEGGDDNAPPCVLIDQVTPWDVILQHIEVSSNRGILLLLLLFALACSLVVAIITFFRWIVYTIQIKSKSINKSQEWNFTKIEERGHDKTGSEHYENLPLTSAEGFDSSPAGERTENDPTSLSVESDDDEEDRGENGNDVSVDVDVVVGRHKNDATETTHTTLEAERTKSPARPTFYDEMICLLQEKLDDPNNYGTVADSQTTCFYQDPQDLQK